MLFTIVIAVAAAAVALRSAQLRSTDAEVVGRWAVDHGLVVTDRSAPLVLAYVRRQVRARVAGASAGAVGALVVGLLHPAVGGNPVAGSWLLWLLLGWLIGAVAAELAMARGGTGSATASLAPRSVDAYLPRWLHRLPAAVAVATAAAAVTTTLVPDPSSAAPGDERLPVATLLTIAAVALGFGAVVTAGMHAVVARRQAAADADVLAADDAMRSSAVHHLAGAGSGALLLLAAELASRALGPHHPPGGLAIVVPLGLWATGILAWRFVPHRRWRVRRFDPVAVR